MPDRSRSLHPRVQRTKLYRYGPLFIWRGNTSQRNWRPYYSKYLDGQDYINRITDDIAQAKKRGIF